MPVVTLPDGSQREFDRAVTLRQVAESISAGLARAAVAGSFMFGGSASASTVATVNYLMSGWSPELNQTVFWQSVNVAELSPTVTAPVCVVANITNQAVVVIY